MFGEQWRLHAQMHWSADWLSLWMWSWVNLLTFPISVAAHILTLFDFSIFSYKLHENSSCIDVDECIEDPGICSQTCVNEIGGFKCECVEGYMRDVHNHTRCKAMESHASLLLARRHDIRKIALDHMEMTSIVNNTKSATALDYVFRTGMIFWSDVSTQSIYK